jgi:hypothetical protein
MNKTSRPQGKGKTARNTPKKTSDFTTSVTDGISDAAMRRLQEYMARTESLHEAWLRNHKDAMFTGILAGSKRGAIRIELRHKLRKAKPELHAPDQHQKESA